MPGQRAGGIFVNIEELAGAIGKHPHTVRRWLRCGIISGRYPGGLRGLGIRFLPTELDSQFRAVGMIEEARSVRQWFARQETLVG